VSEPLLFEVDQLAQRHSQDRVGLDGGQRIAVSGAALLLEHLKAFVAQGPRHHRRGTLDAHDPHLGLGLRLRMADDADDLVDVGQRQQQAFDRVLALPRFGQLELGAAADHRHAMTDELLQHVLQVAEPRLAVDQRQQDDRDRILQRRELVQLVQDHVGVRVPFDVDGDPHRLLQIAQILDCRNPFDLVAVDQFADPFYDPVAVLLEGDFGHNDLRAAVGFGFDGGPRPNQDRPAARVVALTNAGPPTDDTAGREVGALYDFQQFVDRHIRLVDHPHQCVADLAQIVRRNRGGHAHGNPGRPVDQQIGKLRRQHRRLHVPLVIGRYIIHRVQLQVVQQQRRDGRQASFGIPHRSGRQAGDRAKVSLFIDQHVPQVPFLGHADQRRIDHAFAVRMIVAAGIAGDLGAFDPTRSRTEVQVVHGHENAPLRRLQTVPHVGQRAADNHAHGVRQVALL